MAFWQSPSLWGCGRKSGLTISPPVAATMGFRGQYAAKGEWAMPAFRLLAALALGLAAVAAACSSPATARPVPPTATALPAPTATATVSQSIIGRWQLVNGREIVNFYADGTLAYANSGPFLANLNGTYGFIDPTHVRITTTNAFGVQYAAVYDVQIANGQLTLRDAAGSPAVYQRIP